MKVLFKNLYAFTLAEVLITLLIIGTVASMVIPSLINDIHNKDIQVQVKKTYANLNNVLKRITVDNGNIPYQCAYIDKGSTHCNCTGPTCVDACWSWEGDETTGHWVSHTYQDTNIPDRLTSECSAFNTALKAKLNIVKTCTNAYAQGCVANYKSQTDLIADFSSLSYKDQQTQLRNCGDQGTSYKNGRAYVLSNGSVIFPLSSQKLLIDVNGLKGPNKWGYDVVQFSTFMTIDRRHFRFEPDGGCTIIEPGGQSTKRILTQALNS